MSRMFACQMVVADLSGRFVIEAAIERVKRKVDARHYQVFDLYVFTQWPVSRITRALRVNSGNIYLILHRVGNLIKKELASLRTRLL